MNFDFYLRARMPHESDLRREAAIGVSDESHHDVFDPRVFVL
ncbi:MAG: hypothetical protein QGH33_01635 [Pirellulaceae bacterium]|nr:hypothetical protein [Pirellulaceae bacterium]HJN11799.1 hypothetical protein [Pirellulaceae bacterium]